MAGSAYRPICDLWILARAKLRDGKKLYGAYPGGFPERARALLGCRLDQPVLHVCGGMARFYPYRRAFGPHDRTLDLDPACKPDFLRDARDPFPFEDGWDEDKRQLLMEGFNKEAVSAGGRGVKPWAGILIDPPYSEQDAAHYAVGAAVYPPPNLLVKNAFDVLPSGGRVGILHYVLPSPPKNAIFVAAVGVLVGYNNRVRIFSVFEKP